MGTSWEGVKREALSRLGCRRSVFSCGIGTDGATNAKNEEITNLKKSKTEEIQK